jgi:hypothetical protein
LQNEFAQETPGKIPCCLVRLVDGEIKGNALALFLEKPVICLAQPEPIKVEVRVSPRRPGRARAAFPARSFCRRNLPPRGAIEFFPVADFQDSFNSKNGSFFETPPDPAI